MSMHKRIHLFIHLVLQERICEICCGKDLDLLHIISHLTLLRQFHDCSFTLDEPIVILAKPEMILDLTKTIRQLKLKDGMVLRMYL